MKISALALAAIAQVASAHYFFDTNIIGGAAQPAFKYVRQSTRPTKYNPIKFSSNPVADLRDGSTIDGADARCNQGAFSFASKTEVLSVNAGEEVRAKLAVGAKFQHPGPGVVYMFKAPAGNVKVYDGSGDWFKIYEEGVCEGGDFTSTAWCDYNRDYVAAKIPWRKQRISGTYFYSVPWDQGCAHFKKHRYLVRFEHIGVHRSHVNQPEHYVSCLQVKVQGGGSGSPGPMVKFPGAYEATDPYANFSIYNGRKEFPMPGPVVWSGGASSGSSGSTPVENAVTTSAAAKPTTLTTTTKPAPTKSAGNCAAMWGQCAGQGFSGATCCFSGTCKVVNPYYSQCQ